MQAAVAESRRGARRPAAPLLFRVALATALSLLALLSPVAASADPNVSVAATVGGGLSNVGRAGGPAPLFHLGIRGDLLLLRNRDADMAVGPYVDFATAGFSTAEVGGGLEWLVPVTEHVPLILSAGAFGRAASGFGFQPGAEATLFFGSRSLNFNSLYGLGAGVFLQGRAGFGNSKQADAILGAQLDLAILALPFELAFNALRR